MVLGRSARHLTAWLTPRLPRSRPDRHVRLVGLEPGGSPSHLSPIPFTLPFRPNDEDATGVLGNESGDSYARNCQPWG